jgi:histidine triad (HIT) family protein
MADRDPDCIFCQIIAGEAPGQKVDEDEHTIAFMDIAPWTRGHLVVIPKRHVADLHEIDPGDFGRVGAAAQRLAARMRERLGCDGINLLNSTGSAAWQTIFHFHLHVIPRYEGDPLELPVRPAKGDPGEIAAVAEELRGG